MTSRSEQPNSSTPPSLFRDASAHSHTVQRPPSRKLRVYAFDPSLDTQMDTAVINHATLKVPWEKSLEPGPIGEYVEVVDVDPPSGCAYAPVDLNHPYLLASDGLDPSEGNPQFHQQMVYAVAMTTIRNFERALGRVALWSPRRWTTEAANGLLQYHEEYVERLRLYPHAIREANAYYSPEKKALLFGYFPASSDDPGRHLPGGMVFTCLSHDIIAHETTHALLDGMHRRFIEPTNPDLLAFHEAFADIVALFQHFSFPEVLRHQIARTRGDLASQSLLGQLAQEFGYATGRYGALRDALGGIDPQTGQWKPTVPDPAQMESAIEPHARGSILVAAVFDAFLSIYRSRVADLLRIATSGTGVLPAGSLHPDLVNRLANEAAKSAQHVLNMCIRALDYCPPVDLTFGEYLRAVITADYDLVPEDTRDYRIAFVEAFRRRGIYPRDVRSLSVDSLRWPEAENQFDLSLLGSIMDKLRDLTRQYDMTANRQEVYTLVQQTSIRLHGWLERLRQNNVGSVLGLDLRPDGPKVEVHSIRPTRRVGPNGETIQDLVAEITQQRPMYFSEEREQQDPQRQNPDFKFRGGCTVLINVNGPRVRFRYCIVKNINSRFRPARQRAFLTGGSDASLAVTYFGSPLRGETKEPFAFLHGSPLEETP
jgi:hypothetical protein